MTTSIPTPTPTTKAAARAAFTHVTDVIMENENVTKALKLDGIRNVEGILGLDDNLVAGLQYMDEETDPNNPTLRYLNKGDFSLLNTFIHFVHYREEVNDPIGNKWLNITQEEFDQFRCILKYTRRFASLACIRPITTHTIRCTKHYISTNPDIWIITINAISY
jgi:hypothetical protein